MTVEAIETEQIRRIVAVGAIIMASDGRILVVQETVSKPVIDKQPGDWTFPAETLEAGETIIEGVRRMITEEVGPLSYSFHTTQDWIGDYGVKGPKGPIWGRVFLLHAKGSSEDFPGLSSVDGEVINHKWVAPRFLQGADRRKGVWEPLKDFLIGQRGVICEDCTPGVRGN